MYTSLLTKKLSCCPISLKLIRRKPLDSFCKFLFTPFLIPPNFTPTSSNSRLRDPIRRESPGAAAYHPYREDKVKGKLVDRVDPTRPKAAEYTMRIRPPTSARTIGPGPIVYDIRPYKGIKNKENIKPIAVDGNRGPTWAFGQRSNRAPMIVPGDNC